MKRLKLQQWSKRRYVLEAALEVISAGGAYTARQIAVQIRDFGVTAPKSVVNSVLSNEGRRYVSYDRTSFTYCAAVSDSNDSTYQDEVHVLGADLPAAMAPLWARPETSDHSNATISHSGAAPLSARLLDPEASIDIAFRHETGPVFFRPVATGNRMQVLVNMDHPAAPLLAEAIRPRASDGNPGTYGTSPGCMELVAALLTAWALFELEQPNGRRRHRAEEARIDWSRYLRRCIRANDKQ